MALTLNTPTGADIVDVASEAITGETTEFIVTYLFTSTSCFFTLIDV